MREALDLALLGAGKTAPNPMVGCIIVSSDGSKVLGRGYHPAAGEWGTQCHVDILAQQSVAGRMLRSLRCEMLVL